MPRGISLHIGLNQVDPNAYNGWNGALSGCVNDARDMKAIADGAGYASTILIDAGATTAAVCREIGLAAQQLNTGDIFLCTYSGHGGQVPDTNGDEPDGKDETWVLFDRMLIDDELANLWAQFQSGVRIFLLSDSCHSGTVAKMVVYQDLCRSKSVQGLYRSTRGQDATFRAAPLDIVTRNFEDNRAMYETSQWVSGGDRASISASLVLISGCQDNQLSADGARNGLFTQTLLDVWNRGAFSGNYVQFHREIVSRMPGTQTPNFDRSGVPDTTFEAQKPFTIGSGASTSTSSSTRPVINIAGPVMNSAAPPRFTVNPGPNRYYAVEVATNPAYFNNAQNGAQRNDSNFYASWKSRPFLYAPSYPASFDLPQAVWDRFRASASRLYYRIWATDSPNSWVNTVTSVSDSDAQSAPSFDIVAAGAGSGTPSISAPQTFPNGLTPPSFMVNPGPNRYYVVEVTTNPYYFDNQHYGGGRNDDNFYGSWRAKPFSYSAAYPARFEMPQTAWNRLRGSASRLYYRLWATDSPNSWVNHVSTVPDANAASAPYISLARGEGGEEPATA